MSTWSALSSRRRTALSAARMRLGSAGEYETGTPPQPSYWKPGDDPRKLCKIEMPQVANHAIMELITHPALGELAAEITGARWVQVWWVQLLYKPPEAEGGAAGTSV